VARESSTVRSLHLATSVFVLLLLFPAAARAASVLIVRPQRAPAELNQTLVRIHGELLSVGIEVEMANRPERLGRDPAELRAWLDDLASKRGVDAVVDIRSDATPALVDVWVVDKTRRGFDLSRVEPQPGVDNSTERLAVRAIEVLRSKFVELDIASRAGKNERAAKPLEANETAKAATRSSARANARAEVARASDGETVTEALALPSLRSERPPQHVGIQLGAVGWTSLDGVGPGIAPTLGVDWGARAWLAVHVTAAGWGTRPTLSTSGGKAWVAQQYGVVGARYRASGGSLFRPFVGLSAGLLHTVIDAQADLPKAGHASARWSALFDGSVGGELSFPGRYYAILAFHAQVAAPYVAVHLLDDTASSGRPNLLMSLTVGAWL